MFILFFVCLPPHEGKLHEGKGFCLFYSLPIPQPPKQYVAHCRHSHLLNECIKGSLRMCFTSCCRLCLLNQKDNYGVCS